jgi:hypothetical protein
MLNFIRTQKEKNKKPKKITPVYKEPMKDIKPTVSSKPIYIRFRSPAQSPQLRARSPRSPTNSPAQSPINSPKKNWSILEFLQHINKS